MRAAVISNESVAIGERPDPRPNDDELLVEVAAAGLNGADIGQRAGRYPPPDDGTDPSVPGLELAGRVVATGDRVRRFSIGDTVMGLVPGAGQAELATIHERHAMPVPQALDLVSAGGFPEVFSTAHDALFTQARLEMGEHVLVSGAAGGVGIAAVQLALAAGARVTASVRNRAHHGAIAALGATVASPDEALGAGPFDVVLELVGAPNLAGSLQALSTGGRISVIGTSAGARAELDLGLLMRKRARLFGSTLRSRSLEEKALVARRLEAAVLPLVEAGRIRVPIEEAFSLDEVAAAYERFTAGGKLGKIVLIP